MGRIISFDELSSVRQWHPGKRIVHCHGVFDLFHYGHLLHFQSAKRLGEVLVVTVTPDRFVNKGPGRPRFPEEKRAAILAALEAVDYVTINKYPKAIELIHALQPDYYVKGQDYRKKAEDITGGIFEEEDAVMAHGGQLAFTEGAMESSTQLINQHFSQWSDAQRETIEQIREAASLDEIKRIIDSLASLKVLVVGEPIVDTYVFCQPEAMSSKSPTVSARVLYQEDYAGGSLAIANHLSALGCTVSLLIAHGEEPYFVELLKRSVDQKIVVESCGTPGFPTPRKTRFVVPFRTQRMFETIDLRADQWWHVDPAPFCEKLHGMASASDMTVVADFGHGIFEHSVLEAMKGIPSFVAMNVQTNSGNYGFNPFIKHSRYDYLSIDERECRFATHDRFTPIKELARKTVEQWTKKPTSITLATEGSMYITESGKQFRCPSFFKEVIDTTGAGDAYLALTSLLVKSGAPDVLVPFLGNCYAGLKTRIIGNKTAVSKVDFLRTIEALLK